MTVLELFERLRGTEVAILPNPGNCGDGLIWLGLVALCRAYDLASIELLDLQPAEGDVLLVPAAGNLCRQYHGMTELLARYLQSFREIFILPCSVDVAEPTVEKFLRGLPPNVHVFTRERYSYAQARFVIGDDSRISLDRDLAFYYDFEPWKRAGKGELDAFRGDRESCGLPLPEGNVDVSVLGSSGDGEILPRLLRHLNVIRTDRAHVSICAAMLGKQTHIYPNAYHKVRGIYEYSLKALPNVTFHGFDELYHGGQE